MSEEQKSPEALKEQTIATSTSCEKPLLPEPSSSSMNQDDVGSATPKTDDNDPNNTGTNQESTVKADADVTTNIHTNDTTTTTTTTTSTSEETKPISKKQMKKRRRLEKLMAVKKRRKEQAKEVKAAKAKAEGRDLDAERKLQKERQESGEGRKRREERWKEKLEPAEDSFGICIDCGFESEMTYKERNSLALQLRYCYAVNKRSENPVYITVSGLTEGGDTCEQLKKVNGFPEQWKSRAFSCSADPLETLHSDNSKLVYLTSDAEHTLEHLDDSKVYVIGGIVDRNRLKGTTKKKAQELGIETARLPIDDHLKLVATKVLTVNHVFEILLKYRQFGNDWKKALLDVLPNRKEITEVEKAELETKEEEVSSKS